MYRQLLKLDHSSSIEVATRKTGGGDKLLFAMRGSKNDKDVSVASVLLSLDEAKQLIEFLKGWTEQVSGNGV